MKNNLLTFVLIFFLGCIANAQVNNVCATDSIKLNAGNHQLGIIQWEKSYDNEHWESIHNANDKTYSFNPTESAYYRAANKFPYCDPNYSLITLILKKPIAKIGEDRIANGDTTWLYGNTAVGATALWEIVEGEGGTIESPNQSITKFSGVPGSTYTLRYTLQNSCGTSSDLMELKFVENQYYDKLVIIDDTDNITSSETEISNGIYKVTFADPVPTIVNQTILVGITGDGFMRKVESVQQNGNYFEIATSQAKLDEILLDGGLELGELHYLNRNGSGRVSNYKKLNNKPTRADFLNNKLSKGNYYFVVDENLESQFNGVTMGGKNNRSDEEPFMDFNFDNTQIFNQDGLNVKLDGALNFYPNLVGDMEMKFFPLGLKRVHVGMKEAKLTFNAKLTIDAETAAETNPYHFNLLTIRKKMIVVIGGVPFLIQTKTQLEGTAKVSASGEASYVAEFENIYKVNAGIIYNQGNWSTYFDDENTTSFEEELIAKASVTGSLDFGPKTYFTINGLAGPYVDPKMTSDLTLCAASQNLDFNWGVNFDVGAKVTVGIHAYMFKEQLFDKSVTIENRKLYTEKTPYMLEYIAGNNQKYTAGQPLQQPLKVRIMSKNGFYSRNVFVTFEAIDNSGNVSEETVLTDNNGLAQTNFTPTANGSAKVRAYVKNCELSYINYAPFTFVFAENVQEGCEKSSLYAGYVINNNILKPTAHLGTPPYTYSSDLVNFSSSIPAISLTPNSNYAFAVKDTAGCVAYTHYSNNPNNNPTSCTNSNLSLNLEVYGKTIVAAANGGVLPYTYSINGGSFVSTNTFANVIVGRNTIIVKDANGCSRTAEIEITNGTSNVVAYFELPQNIIAGQPVVFNNLSNNATSYSWNFGNGNTSTLVNPSAIFSCNDTYLITLTASNGSNNHTFSREIIITDGQICTVTDIQNHVYNVVKIGEQLWMKENLKTSKLNNGISLMDASSMVNWETNANSKPLYSYLPTINSPTYGYLYNWATVNTGQICPSGWRVPNNNDWNNLVDYLNSKGYVNTDSANGIGNILKSCKQINAIDPACVSSSHPRWNSNSINFGIDLYGFSGLPAGRNNPMGQYGNYGIDGYWWSSDEINSTLASVRGLLYNNGSLLNQTAAKTNGMSIRCIKE